MFTGHRKQRQFFTNAASSGGLSHAYILHGPEGIGKKYFAKEFARGLLCEEGRFFEECGCSACRQVEGGAHPDYYLFENKEDLKIERVRDVAEISGTTSFAGKWKIIIFDDAHVLCNAGADAANALLKTLEEPGKDTIFFLITHRMDRILPTIQSRCLHVCFDGLTDEELYSILDWLGQPKDAVPYAEGSVTAALKMAELNIPGLRSALDKGDKEGIGRIILAVNDKEKLQLVVGYAIRYFIDRYRRAGNAKTVALIQYLTQFLRELDYNVNLNLAVLSAFVAIAEAM
jgi:DNA polymerase-3 subunit delta'